MWERGPPQECPFGPGHLVWSCCSYLVSLRRKELNLKVADATDGPVHWDGPVSGVTLRRCPECGSPRLCVTAFWYGADFVCQECNSCWRIQYGLLFKTEPDVGSGAAPAADAPVITAAVGQHVAAAGATTRPRRDGRHRENTHRQLSVAASAVRSSGIDRTK
jgi:hypothetical protein